MTTENARLYQENYCLKAENAELRKYLAVTDAILAERQRVLEAIPQCEEHGFCVPHALEWIADRATKNVI